MNEIEPRIARLERELEEVRLRNRRVEQDKAWEVSAARRGWVLLLTYLLTSLVFWLIGVEHFLLNAFVPTVGYLLSTLSLPVLRRLWERSIGDDAA